MEENYEIISEHGNLNVILLKNRIEITSSVC